MQNLPDQIIEIVSTLPDQDPLVAQRYLERVKEGLLTRDENNRSHFCVYFLPYDSKAKKVFIIHHKKANLWLAPGGHVDKNEDILHALNREVKEELGVDNAFAESSKPFLLSITPIDNNTQPCKEHFDIWFLFNTDGSNFNVDSHEFYTAKWADFDEARTLLTDPANLQAISLLESK